jgi:hypothetical protein
LAVQTSRNRPPAAPGTGHRDGCSCGRCKGWREAAIEAARLRAFNLQKAQLALVGVREGKKEIERETRQDKLDRTCEYTARKVEELRAAFGKRDPRTEVFLALRAAGRSVADATAEVDRQFPEDDTRTETETETETDEGEGDHDSRGIH